MVEFFENNEKCFPGKLQISTFPKFDKIWCSILYFKINVETDTLHGKKQEIIVLVVT